MRTVSSCSVTPCGSHGLEATRTSSADRIFLAAAPAPSSASRSRVSGSRPETRWCGSRATSGPRRIKPGQFGLPLVARAAPGATTEAVANELTLLARRLPDRFGGSANYARVIAQHRAIVTPLDEALLGGVSRPLWVLFAATAIVLLVACANVANLFMVRAEGRQNDLAVRRAIGATRGQLIRVQMSEAVVVAAAGGWCRDPDRGRDASGISARGASRHPAARRCPNHRMDDALYARGRDARGARVRRRAGAAGVGQPVSHFSATGAGARPRRRHWGRDGLVVGQTALALVLLIGSGLLVRSFWALRNVDPGYDTKDLFTFQIAPESPNLIDGPSFARFDLEFMERLRTLPGVELVGLVENIPLNEGTAGVRFRQEGTPGEADSGPMLSMTFAAGDYFKAMGIDLVAGRVRSTRTITCRICGTS